MLVWRGPAMRVFNGLRSTAQRGAYPLLLVGMVSGTASVSQATSAFQGVSEVDSQSHIRVDLGPWDSPSTREALQLRRSHLVFDQEAPLQLRLRAVEGNQGRVSALLSISPSLGYIHEFSLDPKREDPDRQIATTLANWIDGVLSNKHRPATQAELERERERETPAEEAQDAEGLEPTAPLEGEEEQVEEDDAPRSKSARDPKPARPELQRRGRWTWDSPTRWELGLGMGVGARLGARPILPGITWIDLDATVTPGRILRVMTGAQWQRHPVDASAVHRLRARLGLGVMPSIGAFGLPLGIVVSAERWWASREVASAGARDRLFSMGLGGQVGVSWRFLLNKTWTMRTELLLDTRYSLELPGWVIPVVQLQKESSPLYLGGWEAGLRWKVRLGKRAMRK